METISHPKERNHIRGNSYVAYLYKQGTRSSGNASPNRPQDANYGKPFKTVLIANKNT